MYEWLHVCFVLYVHMYITQYYSLSSIDYCNSAVTWINSALTNKGFPHSAGLHHCMGWFLTLSTELKWLPLTTMVKAIQSAA